MYFLEAGGDLVGNRKKNAEQNFEICFCQSLIVLSFLFVMSSILKMLQYSAINDSIFRLHP